MEEDSYHTIEGCSETVFRDKGSRFLAYAYHVTNEDEIKGYLAELRKRYYDATHHCYAWRIGPEGEHDRANDDGEPSGTAGRPIFGQILSKGLTNILIVVVRYFGGTKLGVPGLINAYRESARGVIDGCRIVERTVNVCFDLGFPYVAVNDVMKIVKETGACVISQEFDNTCEMQICIRRSRAAEIRGRLEKSEGVVIKSGSCL